jgi:hypothetical protein
LKRLLVFAFVSCLAVPSAILAAEIRIDTFDKKSNRTGYIVIDPRTGRLDQFDSRGNRLGYGTATSPPSSSSDRMYDQNGRSISIDRRAR